MKRNNKNFMTKEYQKGNQMVLVMTTSTKIQPTEKRNLTLTIHNVQKNMLKTPKGRFSKYVKDKYEDVCNNAIT
jgi:hypothetical protein